MQEISKAIKMFKTESNKKIELSYLRFLTGNYKTKLFFTKSTSTDGTNVYIHVDHPYITDPKNNAIEKTFEDLNFDKKYLDNKFTLLKLFCRGGLVHEAGHILFNDFDLLEKAKKDFKRTELKYFHQLLNIVLDANMELSMINYYEGVREYLEFSNCLAYHNLDTVEEYEEKTPSLISVYYYWAMFYTIMGREKGQVQNPEILKYVEETKPLLTKARYERDMWVKYDLIKEIFSILKPLIEESKKQNDLDFNLDDFLPENVQISPSNGNNGPSSNQVQISIDFKTSNNKLPDSEEDNNEQSSSQEQSSNQSSNGNSGEENNEDDKNSQGNGSDSEENQTNNNDDISSGFGFGYWSNDEEEENNNSNSNSNSEDNTTQEDKSSNEENTNNKSNSNEEDSESDNKSNSDTQSEEDKQREKEYLEELIETLTNDLEKVQKEEEKREKQENADKQQEKKFKSDLNTANYGSMHSHISIKDEKVPDTEDYHIRAYEDIYDDVKTQIKGFSKKLLKILKEQKEDYETKLIAGSRLDMRRIYDKKDLVWKSKKDNKEFADLSISVYVDGSQSMCDKIRYIRKALVILHATCVELNIPITIVEGRATYRKNEVKHKILCNFKNFKKEDIKYNMVKVDADDNTREGISLKWVNDYHNMQSPTSDKLFIVLSDGEPFHAERNGYYMGSDMIKDCKNVYKKITKNGTVVMPIALGNGVYESLTQIYPKVINCEEEHFNKLGDILCKQIKKNLYKK